MTAQMISSAKLEQRISGSRSSSKLSSSTSPDINQTIAEDSKSNENVKEEDVMKG